MPKQVSKGHYVFSQEATQHPEGLLYLSQMHGAMEGQLHVKGPGDFKSLMARKKQCIKALL